MAEKKSYHVFGKVYTFCSMRKNAFSHWSRARNKCAHNEQPDETQDQPKDPATTSWSKAGPLSGFLKNEFQSLKPMEERRFELYKAATQLDRSNHLLKKVFEKSNRAVSHRLTELMESNISQKEPQLGNETSARALARSHHKKNHRREQSKPSRKIPKESATPAEAEGEQQIPKLSIYQDIASVKPKLDRYDRSMHISRSVEHHAHMPLDFKPIIYHHAYHWNLKKMQTDPSYMDAQMIKKMRQLKLQRKKKLDEQNEMKKSARHQQKLQPEDPQNELKDSTSKTSSKMCPTKRKKRTTMKDLGLEGATQGISVGEKTLSEKANKMNELKDDSTSETPTKRKKKTTKKDLGLEAATQETSAGSSPQGLDIIPLWGMPISSSAEKLKA